MFSYHSLNLLPVGALGLFLALLVLLEFGSRLAISRGDMESSRLGPTEGAIFGLLGLMIAFVFSGASIRFGDRRELIINEANALGTVALRCDLLSASARPQMIRDLRSYADARLEVDRHIGEAQLEAQLDLRIAQLQHALWSRAVADTRGQADTAATTLLLPALNDLFDLATKRSAAAHNHPPWVIYVLLIGLTMACAFLAGYSFGPGQAKHRIAMVSFAAIMSFAIYVIVDLEFPRFGLIRVDAQDVFIEQVRDSLR